MYSRLWPLTGSGEIFLLEMAVGFTDSSHVSPPLPNSVQSRIPEQDSRVPEEIWAVCPPRGLLGTRLLQFFISKNKSSIYNSIYICFETF